jgi:hypothetical protein
MEEGLEKIYGRIFGIPMRKWVDSEVKGWWERCLKTDQV